MILRFFGMLLLQMGALIALVYGIWAAVANDPSMIYMSVGASIVSLLFLTISWRLFKRILKETYHININKIEQEK